MTSIKDISAPLTEDLVTWPEVVERFKRTLVENLEAGDKTNVSHFEIGAHAGTHIDAPNHFLPGTGGIESIPLEILMGRAQVIRVPATTDVITADVLGRSDIAAGATRLLARTRNSGWTHHSFFDEGYVAFDLSAAEWCIDNGIGLVGIDYLSIESFSDSMGNCPVHKSLLAAGVVVLESLELIGVDPGEYELIALPLLVPGSDGAPARAMLRNHKYESMTSE